MFEIIDYLVHFNTKKCYPNFDLIDLFGKKLIETASYSKIEPYRMQHIMPQASANQTFIGKQKFWENHRLVPIIDNKGMISGTYIMLNKYIIYKPQVFIKDEIHDLSKIDVNA